MQKRNRTMYVLSIFVGVIAALGLLVWLGLQIRPGPLPPFPQATAQTPAFVPLPTDLPAPVARYYRHILGAEQDNAPQIPVITSAVISGRASLRISGITFPARFRFTHRAGQDYRHYLEATVFGLPLMKVNEVFLNGSGRMELPFGVVENEPNINQAGNLGLWAESIWLPSIFLTDTRVRWQAVDEDTALLIVPYGNEEEHFVVRFDPETGLLMLMESMRYKEAGDMRKILWLNETRAWGPFEHWLLPSRAALIWLDEGTPWAVFEVEEVVYNVDIDRYIEGRGP